jgi:Glu-tRNA(Gln) amidotransferase subunit E-like FAD-binding protein
VYEFFSRYIGTAILEGRDSDVLKAKALIKKHFNKTTDLSKELHLFRTLYESNVESKEMAVNLLNRVREVVKCQSQPRLDLEKTALIHEINTALKDPGFFNKNIPDYKTYATIQIVLNNWRDVSEQTLTESLSVGSFKLEEQIVEHLTRKQAKQQNEQLTSAMTNADVDKLILNLMTEKVNQKFGNKLSVEQKKILELYVFDKESQSEKSELTDLLEGLKQNVLSSLSKSQKEFGKDKILLEKLNSVKVLLEGKFANTSDRNDEMISFYMGLPLLQQELNSNDDGK